MSFLSGACDGEVRIWDLPSQKTIWSVYAHKKFVRGLTVDRTGSTFLSCSDDCTIKQYQLNMDIDGVCFSSLVLEVLGNPGPRVRARSVEHLGRQGRILVFHRLFDPIPLVASITAGRTTSSRPAPPTSISGPRRGARLSIPSRTVQSATSASSSTLLKPMCWLLVVTIVLLPCLMYMSLSASHVVGPQQLDPSSSGSEHDVQLCRLEPSRAHVLHGGTYSLERMIVIRATKTTTCIRSICVYWTSQ